MQPTVTVTKDQWDAIWAILGGNPTPGPSPAYFDAPAPPDNEPQQFYEAPKPPANLKPEDLLKWLQLIQLIGPLIDRLKDLFRK